jgi:6-phospho-beta-glucosidase
LKIAIIGAGGLRTPLLIRGLASSDLPIREIALYDIDRTRLKRMARLADLWKGSTLLVVCDRSEDALRDADFVYATLRGGGMEARAKDERTCLDRGVLGQETVGAAGFALALRNIPPMIEYARQVERVAPDAFVINFTNPVGMITQAVRGETDVNIVGICDTPAELFAGVARKLGVDVGRCRFDYFGLNHLGWLREVEVDGSPRLDRFWNEPDRCEGIYRSGLFETEFLRNLRLLPSEYLYFYYRTAEAIGHLGRGGRTRGEALLEMNDRFIKSLGGTNDALFYEQYLAERDASYFQLESGTVGHQGVPELTGYDKIGVAVARAIHFDTGEEIAVNVANRGCLSDLEADDVIEVPSVADHRGATPVPVRPIPESVRELVLKVKNYERLAIRAAVEGDSDLAQEALAGHPLVPDRDTARQLMETLVLS